jgi:spermidine synthase
VKAPALSQKRSPWALYLVFLVSGSAGLVYQVMWTRSFGLVFGSSTRAAAVVLAAFFLGMAIGNWLGGRVSLVTRASALRRYAWLELAIAGGALLVLGWLALYHAVYPALYQATFQSPAALSSLQLALAVLALAPPCIAMGATLPLMSRAVVSTESHIGRRLGLVYALNTVGGVAGVILSGFWLPVTVGVRGSMFVAAALNVAAAAAALALARRLAAGALAGAGPGAAPSAPRRGWQALALVAIVSGFGTLALEVLFTRLLVNAIDSSVFSFALVLASFLVSLALGSALVSALADRLRSHWGLIAAGSWLGAAAILLAPWLCTLVWIRTDEEPWLRGPLGAATVLLPAAFAVTGPASIFVGMVLPATWRAAIETVESTGALVGRLTSLNTLAGVAGSLAMGFLLIPALGVSHSTLLIASLYALLGAFAALRDRGSRGTLAIAVAGAVCFAGLASQGAWQIVPVIVQTGYRLVALDEGEGATISVTENKYRVRYLSVNSRYTLGSSSGVAAHRSQGELALALHGDPRDVAFIGVATGLSVSSIQSYPSVERVVAMELLPGVLRLAEAFREENGGVLEDPRVELRLADGRNHLFGSAQRFDAVVGDLFVPWHAGTGYLYTVEHFENVHERLREGGVFVQWLQRDQISLLELKSVARSFTEAFEDAELWVNSTQRARPMLGFVGYRERPGAVDPHAQIDRMRRICGADLLREWAAEAPLNTDDFPFIEFSAAASHLGSTRAKTREVAAAVDWLRAEERKRWLDGAPEEMGWRLPSE